MSIPDGVEVVVTGVEDTEGESETRDKIEFSMTIPSRSFCASSEEISLRDDMLHMLPTTYIKYVYNSLESVTKYKCNAPHKLYD